MRHKNKLSICLNGLPRVVSVLLVAAMLNGCALHKIMQMETYEEYAEVSSSIWVNLYFAFNDIAIPGYEKVIYKNTVWKKENSPIVIDENLFILPGVTVSIEPGVKVLLGEKVRVTCRGLIKALGSKDAPITFTWKDEGRYWTALECLNATGADQGHAGKIEFKYCIVEYGRGLRINSSDLEITHSVFRHHISAAIQLEYAGGLIANNQVYANSTERETESGNGAGIKVFTNRSVRVENNAVHDNVSAGGRDGGGGIYAFAYDGGKVAVTNNTVTNNRSDRKGGGIFAYDALVKDNIVRDNVADMTGGGIYALQAVAQNNVVSGNRSDEGGGIFSNDADIIHNLIRNNQAAKGAGIFHLGAGKIENNSFAENHQGGAGATDTDAVIVMVGNATVRRNNIVAKRGYALRFLSHNLSPDLNARENYWGTDDEKVIEKGIYDWLEDSKVGLVDWKMYATGPIVEAYPFPDDVSSTYTPVVDTFEPGEVRGVIEKDTVWGQGPDSRYTLVGNLLIEDGSTLTIDKNTSLTMKEGVSIRVRGRLAALGEESRPVVFTGNPDKPWDQLLFENRSLTASNQDLGDDNKSLLAYCTIENGAGVVMDGKGANLLNCRIQNNRGSGVRIKEVPVTIKGCSILNNTSESDGGGIYAYGSRSINITDNVIKNNRAKDGGGIFAYGYQSNVAMDMRNNLIQANTSQGDGGGIWASRSAVVGNKIIGNRTQNKGGGIYAGFAIVNDNQVMDNSALEGGGIYGESNNKFIGNTIVKNVSLGGLGGGVYLNYWGLSKDNKAFNNNLVKQNKTHDGQGTGGICLNGDIEFIHNAIFNNAGLQLTNLTPLDIGAIKAQTCFWGTVDTGKIEKMIHDGTDDAALSLVEYEPVAQTAAVTGQRDKASEDNP